MQEIKLKPCPYCKESWLYVSDGDYGSGYESKGYRVECQCGFAWKSIAWKKNKEEAIEYWNEWIDWIEAKRKEMPRYIDANKIKYKTMSFPVLDGMLVRSKDIDNIVERQDIDNIPTANVQEVVHCKDCIHRDPEDKKCDGVFCAKNGLLPMDDNDYCSYGERKK